MLLPDQPLAYDLALWAVFVGIVFGAAYRGRWAGLVLGHLGVAVAVFAFDCLWIESEMSRSGWDPGSGPDRDFAFMIVTLMRVVLFNAVLLPVGLAALRLAARKPRPASP
jgi:hypothetical protein